MSRMTQIARRPDVALIRRRARLSQAELGKALGLSANTISRWERGVMSPDMPNIHRLEGISGLLQLQELKARVL